MEVGVDDIYRPGSVLDIPKRPPWNYSMTKEMVEGQEEAMFEKYLRNIYSSYKSGGLSYFEHNLEVIVVQDIGHHTGGYYGTSLVVYTW